MGRLLKGLLFSVLLSLVYCPLQASELPKILNLLTAKKIYQADFHQKRSLPFLKGAFKSKGRIVFHAQYGIIWELQEPIAQTNLISSQGISPVEKVAGQFFLQQQGSVPSNFLVDLFGLFQGDLVKIEQGFVVQATASTRGYQLLLTPKNEILEGYLSKIEVHINKQGEIQQLNIHEPKGGRLEILIQNYQLLKSISAEQQEIYDLARP